MRKGAPSSCFRLESAVSSPHPSSSSLVAFILFATCTLHTRRGRSDPRNLPPLPCASPESTRIPPLFSPLSSPMPRHPVPFASYHLAPLLLSDYCAAVTAMCRFVCIRMIHFWEISVPAPHEFRLTRACKSLCTWKTSIFSFSSSLFLFLTPLFAFLLVPLSSAN